VSPPLPPGSTEPVPVGHVPLVGDVVEFDEPRGLGVVEYGPGRRVGFHCTAITDGSRQIAVGTVVAVVVSAGRLGRLEARSVRPLPGVVRPGSTLDPAGYGGPGSVPAAGESPPRSVPSAPGDSTPSSGTPAVGSAPPGSSSPSPSS